MNKKYYLLDNQVKIINEWKQYNSINIKILTVIVDNNRKF